MSFTAKLAQIEKCLTIAKGEIGVVEAPGHKNTGKRINEYQHVTGNGPGDSWCMSFVMWCLVQSFGATGFPPLPRSGSCQVVREAARKLGWIVRTDKPQPGWIGLLIDAPRNHAHHTFWVTGKRILVTKSFPTCEGNTNPAGGREGYGVFDRKRKTNGSLVYEYIQIPTAA